MLKVASLDVIDEYI